MKMLSSIILTVAAVILCCGLLPTTAIATESIEKLTITMPEPTAGELPQFTATMDGAGYGLYDENSGGFAGGVCWTDETKDTSLTDAQRMLKNGGAFLPGHTYRVTVELVADNGYEFSNPFTATVNGQAADKAYLYADMATVSYLFPALPAETTSISSVSVTVPVPTAGENPSYSASVSGIHYAVDTGWNAYGSSNGVGWALMNSGTWNDVDLALKSGATFATGKIYMIAVALKPDSGYSFASGLTSDLSKVLVNGSPASHAMLEGNRLIVYSVFPPVTAASQAADSGTCGKNLTWTLDDEGTLTISGTGDMNNYSYNGPYGPWSSRNIKSVIIESDVTSIGSYAFYGCTDLNSVTIPDSVMSIGEKAFYGCTSMTSVTIGSGVTTIGYRAFYKCDGLSDIYITDLSAWCNIESVYYLFYTGDDWYSNVHNLYLNGILATNIEIPDSVTSIGNYAFYGCTSLTSVTFPDSVTSIGGYAFNSCTSLTNVTVGSGVTSIGDNAFWGCTGLTGIYITDLSAWCKTEFGDNPLTYAHNLYLNGILATNIEIPDSVTSIGDCAFYGCTSLTSVTIPNSVTSIGNGAFSGCNNLTDITINMTEVPSTFNGQTSIKNIVLGDNVTRISDYAFYYCTGLTSVTIGNGLTSIGDHAFDNCTSLSDFTINMKDIPNIFKGMTCIKNLILSDNVTSIGEEAFSGCTNLTSVINGNGVTSIGYNAFYNTPLIRTETSWNDDYLYIGHVLLRAKSTIIGKVPMRNGTTAIAYNAFYGRDRITRIDIPDSVTCIGESAFQGCTGLTQITIPDSVTSIGGYAFSGCSGLTSATIGNGVTDIGHDAFYNCTGLTNVEIGSSVTSIGNYAFSTCKSLTSVTIPDSVTSIGKNAFIYCNSLTSVTVGSGVTNIREYTFYNCTDLASLTIKGNVTSIGENAFSNCPRLSDLTLNMIDVPTVFKGRTSIKRLVFGDNVTYIENSAFKGCTGLTSVSIPQNVEIIYNYAFDGCTGLEDVYYGGTEAEWNDLDIGNYNDPLKNAKKHYESDIGSPISASFSAVNYDGEAVTATLSYYYCNSDAQLVLAIYKNGQMIKLSTAEVAAGSESSTVSIPVTGLSGTYQVKAFFLNSGTSAPICKSPATNFAV